MHIRGYQRMSFSISVDSNFNLGESQCGFILHGVWSGRTIIWSQNGRMEINKSNIQAGDNRSCSDDVCNNWKKKDHAKRPDKDRWKCYVPPTAQNWQTNHNNPFAPSQTNKQSQHRLNLNSMWSGSQIIPQRDASRLGAPFYHKCLPLELVTAYDKLPTLHWILGTETFFSLIHMLLNP